MVVAPHPDDETLAAGGLIRRVVEGGGSVRVIFVTDGDGYVDGLRAAVPGGRMRPADFIRYGRRRTAEAQDAAQHLGLRPRDALFLGFPDGGIHDLWNGHWSDDRPFQSPYTHLDHPRYARSVEHHIAYAGSDLKSELMQALRAFAPDWVILPDPRDRHPDHCATGVFVLDALQSLRNEPGETFERTEAFTYLVHYPDYPSSTHWLKGIDKAGVGGSIIGGRTLSATHWFGLPLTAAELAAKQRAVSAYRTQDLVMPSFLSEFLRPFEFFGRLNAGQVTTVTREYGARARRRR